MASKNLGAVIQRAISDGAFRRQLQSDPATALRGFNLSPDEVAAIRSGDSGKLMSLGVDQRMSKAFSVGASFSGPSARSTVSDGLGAGTSSAITDGAGSIARENISGDPTSNGRSALTADTDGDMRSAITPGDTASTSDMKTTGALSGTRAANDLDPADGGRQTSVDPTMAGTRSVLNGTGQAGSSALEDPNSPEFAARLNSDPSNSGTAIDDPYSGKYTGVTPDFQAGRSVVADTDGAGGGSMISADDNFSVASRMADAHLADGTTAQTSDGSEFLGGAARLDPGIDSSHGFIPSDSADVQRELLDGTTHGDGSATADPSVDGDARSWG